MKIIYRRGFSLVELAACAVCLVMLGALVRVVLGQAAGDAAGTAPALHPKTLKDAAQLRDIHQGILVFARAFGGIFPRPGLINRLADPTNGQQTPGRGPEDVQANTTANLYSVMIMGNYLTPEIMVSPIERNPKVAFHQEDYNYQAYNPVKDVYWNTDFKADLVEGSNVSYAHMPIFGKRAEAHWRESLDGKFPILGNRGPKDGKLDPSSYTCAPHGQWCGNVMPNIGQSGFISTVTPDGLCYTTESGEKPDNIFAMEDGPEGADAILTFTKRMTMTGPLIQHD